MRACGVTELIWERKKGAAGAEEKGITEGVGKLMSFSTVGSKIV